MRKVLVILVNYNSETDTKVCVDSLFRHEEECDVNVVIVVNAFKQKKILNELSNDERVNILYPESNIGFGRANNYALDWAFKHLDFEYVYVLNNDTVIDRGVITALAKVLDEERDVVIATPRIMYLSEPEKVWYGGGEIRMSSGRPYIYDFGEYPSKSRSLKDRYVTFVSGCSMLFKRDFFDKNTLFDDRFFMYCEDLELCIRINRMGLKMKYLGSIYIYHKVHGSAASHNKNNYSGTHIKNPNLAFHFLNIYRNRRIAMNMHLNGKEKFVFNLLFFFDVSFHALKFSLNGRFKPALMWFKILF
ncbi:glycosyltransferase family 2 protein [Ekhidna sp.]|uniref:glycosyltransferase family 2 protein n=1 Tax=Ekhidna sp. TaxID=2608089 RepID=UPI003B5AF57B